MGQKIFRPSKICTRSQQAFTESIKKNQIIRNPSRGTSHLVMPLFFIHAPDFLRIFSSASGITARLVTICILLLSLAPLGSIYVLLVSLGIFGVVVEDDDPFSAVSNSLHPQSQNITLEELWSIVFQDYGRQSKGNRLVLAFVPLGQQHISVHWRIFLPWALSFVVGVILPTSFSLWTFFRNRRIHLERTRKRQKRLNKAIRLMNQEYSKQLALEDLVLLNEATQNEVPKVADVLDLRQEDDTPAPKWRLPVAGSSLKDKVLLSRTVDEGCTICLNPYELRESVSWSSNVSCVHTFHEQCITEWLSRKRNKSFACPCCRQNFVSLPREAKLGIT
jgi:hypothetical protein